RGSALAPPVPLHRFLRERCALRRPRFARMWFWEPGNDRASMGSRRSMGVRHALSGRQDRKPARTDPQLSVPVAVGETGIYCLEPENSRVILTKRAINMLPRFRAAWFIAILSWSAVVYAQTGQGTLTGSVTDSTGAMV